MKKVILTTIAMVVVCIAYSQSIINVQAPTTFKPNHETPTPIDFTFDQNTGLNQTYTWNKITNLLQGVNILLYPTDIAHIYLQQNNGRLAFNLLGGGTFLLKLEVNYDNQGWENKYDGNAIQSVGWITPNFSGSNSLGVHNLKVKYLNTTAQWIEREYEVYITHDCQKLYKDNHGNTMTVWEANNSNPKKPILIFEGFDAGNTGYAEYIRDAANGLINELNNNDYSVFVLDASHGGQDIEANASMMAAATRYVSKEYNNQDIAVGGVSMGGQVSRWMVCEAEGNNRALPVSHWISFDSPHQSALMDADLLGFTKTKDPNNKSLQSTAAKQMLAYNPFDETGVRVAYENKRNALNNGNYPQQTINIGVAFSNGLPNPHGNKQWFHVKGNLSGGGGSLENHYFHVKKEWGEAGSYLPKTSVIKDRYRLNFDAFYAWVIMTRDVAAQPTFVSFRSALDIDANGNSRFCISIYPTLPTRFYFHDEVPDEIVQNIVNSLQTGNIADVATGTTLNFAAEENSIVANPFNVFGKMYVNGNLASGRSTNPQGIPAANSEYLLSTSCDANPIRIKSGGELIVGDNINALKGTFTLGQGAKLILENGSKLIINANSRLLVGLGSSIVVEQGAEIQLNAPTAILEIRGNLELGADVVFKPLGTGHVLFNIPPKANGAPNIIVNGTNCIMDFAGTSREKKIEVASGTYLFPPYNLDWLKIENVKVEMGLDAGIKVNGKLHLVNSEITKLPSISEPFVHNGITLGYLTIDEFISDNKITNGKKGISITAPNSKYDVRLKQNEFIDCDNAIEIQKTKAHIAGNKFVNGSFGIRAGALRASLRIESNLFENVSSSIEALGSGYPEIALGGNVINNSVGYGLYQDQIRSTLKCNYFNDASDGAYVRGSGSINMSPTPIALDITLGGGGVVTGGENYFKVGINSGVSVVDNSFNFTRTFFNDGYNTFNKGASTNSIPSLNISNPFNNTSPNPYRIDNNHWTPLQNAFCSSPPPIDFIDINNSGATHFTISENYTPSCIVGIQSSVTQSCPIINWNDAIANPTTFNPLSKPASGLDEINNLNNPYVLNTGRFGGVTGSVPAGTFQGQNLITAFSTVYSGSHVPTVINGVTVYMVNPSTLLDFANLLTNTYSLTYSSSAFAELHSYGYQTYISLLSKAYGQGIFDGNEPAKTAQLSGANELFGQIHQINDQLNQAGSDAHYSVKYTTDFDKTTTYWIFEKFTDAENTINAIKLYVRTEDDPKLDYTYCLVNNERLLNEGQFNLPVYEKNIANCAHLYQVSTGTYAGSGGSGSSQQTQLNYTMTPNPATTDITLNVNQLLDAEIEVSVFNKFGIKMMNDIYMGTQYNNTSYTINLPVAGWATDVYTVIIYADGIPYPDKFVKQ